MTIDDKAPAAADGAAGYGPADSLLTRVVHGIEHVSDAEVSIVLTVSGVIISGVMISATAYFAELAEHDAGGLGELFTDLARQSRAYADARPEDEELDPAETPLFIHLKRAAVHAPGAPKALPAGVWRGRLDHVSGWSFGQFITGPSRTGVVRGLD